MHLQKKHFMIFHTVCLTSIYYQVPGNREFCVAPSKTSVGLGKIIISLICGIVTMLKTSRDMCGDRLLNKKHLDLIEYHFSFKIHSHFSNLEFQNQ